LSFAVAAFVLVTVGYLFFVALLSAVPARRPEREPGRSRLFVFIVPALDEALVLRNTLDSLMALPEASTFTVVVDDGSTDETPEIVHTYPPERVRLLQRVPPEARQGKGAALNAAFRLVRCRFEGADLSRVIVSVVDADGRLAPDVLEHVEAAFDDPAVGALQVMVRIFNRDHWLARFQDFEFVSFSALVQRGREHLGSVGLGGNGQFVRLSALCSLGEAPWTDCLTEDLDLGLRLAMNGWQNRFTAATAVEQQGVVGLLALWRQRTRWLHGHLQCWRHLPGLIRSDLPSRTVGDLTYYLAAPLVLLIASVVFTLPLGWLGWQLVAGNLVVHWSAGMVGYALLWYLLAFAPSLLLSFAYWRQARDIGLARALVLGHLLLAYNYVWYAAAWRALVRILLARRGWSKTVREPESSDVTIRSSGPEGLVAGGR
jgi:cellulose synthase/poly-beta-1,6-N-acetylglucosamine synthase-like glycosyltransferase